MGQLLVLVCPCFGENVIVTCKIVSFLCSLDNFLLKNVIVSFLEIRFQNGAHLRKGYFWPTFHIFGYQGKDTKIPSAHISLTYKHIFCSPIDFFALPILQNYTFIMYGFSLVWLLVLILFCAILEQSVNNKRWAKFRLECLLLIFITDIYLHQCKIYSHL